MAIQYDPNTDTADTSRAHRVLSAEARDFYCRADDHARRGQRLPFLVGGAYAFARYTGIERHTKDFDVFVRPRDFDRALEVFEADGPRRPSAPSRTGSARRYEGDDFVDLIFSSGNGVARVDDLWFEHAVDERGARRPGEAHSRPRR